MRLYIASQNLIVWTKYPGYDPEVRTYTKKPQKRGVDFGTYPGTKTFLVGLKFIINIIMSQNFKYCLIIYLGIISIVSCNVLDEEPFTQPSTENSIKMKLTL